jgi:isopentenyl-diphosphate delta-isomerase
MGRRQQKEEHVVLVNDENQPIGSAPKGSVHHSHTPLHRAFSCFVFDQGGRVLMQQRAHHKQTWPGVWSNSCCGHPLPGEEMDAAVRRRLHHELALRSVNPRLALPSYRYRAEYQGVVEHEICPVWLVETEQEPAANADEVAQLRWLEWPELVDGVRQGREQWFVDLSPWCQEETLLLHGAPAFREFWHQLRRVA